MLIQKVGFKMNEQDYITIFSEKKNVNIPVKSILYVIMDGNNAFFHISQNEVYQTRMTLVEIEKKLGKDFIKVKRGCLVSVIAIHDVNEKIVLNNGETLDYARRHSKEVLAMLRARQEEIIRGFNKSVSLTTEEDYHEHYKLFDELPIAFADIEMVFDEQFKAVDWIFRYGNKALAELEKVPLKKIIGASFSQLFPNMDFKWVRTYERATLFGETIKIVDYSPEIDSYLDIVCFPTFKGHCGCILFDVTKITSFRSATDTEKALSLYFARLIGEN